MRFDNDSTHRAFLFFKFVDFADSAICRSYPVRFAPRPLSPFGAGAEYRGVLAFGALGAGAGAEVGAGALTGAEVGVGAGAKPTSPALAVGAGLAYC